ncbi:hypothetical protein RRG08_009205 [Elysia crispata]|uniref:Fibrinogen C-terminal domain-containing protein n=1 Tax=Elysia crispata TaxID=231223 RepID=A0AAE0ZEU1_9GAST|nr:hypothetical protein RRG08_009205 [Elysia crispata]
MKVSVSFAIFCLCTQAGISGKEVVYSTGSQHVAKAESGTQTQKEVVSSGFAIQQLVLLQGLDTKLSLLESSLNSKFEALDIRLTSLKDRLEDKILSVQEDVESFKEAVEDKIENRVIDKLCQLDIKLSTGNTFMKDSKIAASDETEGCLASVKEELQKVQNKIFSEASVASGRVEDLLNSTSVTISALQEDLTKVLAYEQADHVKFTHLNGEAQKIMNISERLTEQVRNNFLQLNANTQQCSQFASSMILKSENMVTSIRSFLDGLLATSLNVLRAVFNPKSCRKGMVAISPDVKFPYPVIRPSEESGLEVPYLCDTISNGGGWIIIQRRATGDTDFYRNWNTYKRGFGKLDGDFWLGNENIHTLTSSATYELRIELKFKKRSYFAHYESFSISDEENKYKLSLGNYHGTAGNSLDHERGRPFSTYDRDNDAHHTNCAEVYVGAWWYGHCHNSNLNAQWQVTGEKAPRWKKLTEKEPVTFSEMKIRRVE